MSTDKPPSDRLPLVRRLGVQVVPYSLETPGIQISQRSCHVLFAAEGSFSREGRIHQPPEKAGDYALDPICCSTHAGEEPSLNPRLRCSQLPSSSGAAIHNILDCSWLPKCLENYSKLN